MKNLIVGTAGHIDHGKTFLIKALTGIDADRLAEEKERGITIDIGFADLQLSEYRIGFIDVPGHEKFVKNMLAGIGGIQLVMLVIAADESIMPQTIEHFQICRLLKIPRGIVVLTKCDEVDKEILELVRAEVCDLVQGSFLENAPCCAVDSLSGNGMEALKLTLEEQSKEMDREGLLEIDDQKVFRLYVDRVFSVKGFGTVVTGTAQSGLLRKDTTVEVLPASRLAKVRGIQIFGGDTSVAYSGQRTAINLTGVERASLYRGAVLADPDQLEPSQIIDAQIQVLPDAPAALGYRSPIRFHHGSGEQIGRVYPLEEHKISPGTSGFAQIRLESPTVCLPGDRFILRRYSPLTTVGGGIVLNNHAGKHRRKEMPDVLPSLRKIHSLITKQNLEALPELLQSHIHQSGVQGMGVNELVRRTGYTEQIIRKFMEEDSSLVISSKDPPRYVRKSDLEKTGRQLAALVEKKLSGKPLSPGVSKEEIKDKFFKNSSSSHYHALLDWFVDQNIIVSREEFLTLPGRQVSLSANQNEIRKNILHHLTRLDFQPGSLADFQKLGRKEEIKEVFFHLIRTGELIKIADDLVLTPAQLENVEKQIRLNFAGEKGFSVPEFKNLTSLSRKYAIPILEFMDRERITQRAGNRRRVVR